MLNTTITDAEKIRKPIHGELFPISPSICLLLFEKISPASFTIPVFFLLFHHSHPFASNFSLSPLFYPLVSWAVSLIHSFFYLDHHFPGFNQSLILNRIFQDISIRFDSCWFCHSPGPLNIGSWGKPVNPSPSPCLLLRTGLTVWGHFPPSGSEGIICLGIKVDLLSWTFVQDRLIHDSIFLFL